MTIGCGRTCKKHALEHSAKSGHSIAMGLYKPMIWCYICDEEVTHPEEATNLIFKSAFPEIFGEDEEMEGEEEKKRECEVISFEKRRKRSENVRGVCGLYNLGNTCFMNSALQCVSNCYPLRRFFTKCSFEVENSKSDVVQSFTSLIHSLWSGEHSAVKPASLLRAISRINPTFLGYEQQDSQEFLRCLLDSLHEATKRKLVVSPLPIQPQTSETSPIKSQK